MTDVLAGDAIGPAKALCCSAPANHPQGYKGLGWILTVPNRIVKEIRHDTHTLLRWAQGSDSQPLLARCPSHRGSSGPCHSSDLGVASWQVSQCATWHFSKDYGGQRDSAHSLHSSRQILSRDCPYAMSNVLGGHRHSLGSD